VDAVNADRATGEPVPRCSMIQAQPLPLSNSFRIQSTIFSARALLAASGISENRVTSSIDINVW
jgi:hypothetical protein